MKKLSMFAGTLVAIILAFGLLHSAIAATYTSYLDYTPTGGPVSPTASPGAVPNFVDGFGSIWGITSGNGLTPSGEPLGTSGNGFNVIHMLLSRGGATGDQQIRVRYTANSGMANNAPAVCTHIGYSTSAITGYCLYVNATSVNIIKETGTLAFTSLTSATFTSVAATDYYLTLTDTVSAGVNTLTGCLATVAVPGTCVAAPTTTDSSYVRGLMGLYQILQSGGTLIPMEEVTLYGDTTISSVAPSSTALHYSPRNWQCFGSTTCASGVTNPRTIQPGAYYCAAFTASATPTMNLMFGPNVDGMPVSVFVNGVLYDAQATAVGTVPVAAVPSATNEVMVVARQIGNPGASIWGQTGANFYGLESDGIQLDAGSTAGTALAPCQPSGATGIAYKGWALVQGDSINVGYLVDNGADDYIHSNVWMVAQALFAQGYDVGSIATSGSGVLYAGAAYDNFVPGLCIVTTTTGACTAASRWNLVDLGVSALDSNGQLSAHGATGTAPSLIFTNIGTNDANESVSQTLFGPAIKQMLTTERAAAPSAKMVLLPGLPLDANTVTGGTTYLGLMATGAASYTGDPSFTYADFGSTWASMIYNNAQYHFDSFHPMEPGNAIIAPKMTTLINTALSPASSVTCSGSRSCAIVSGALLGGG